MEFLEKVRVGHPELANEVLTLMNLYDNKLWHQLSIHLEKVLTEESSASAFSSLELYDDFVSTFENKINEVKLACIISLIGRRLPSPQDGIDLYERVLQSSNKLKEDAVLFLSMEIARMQIQLGLLEEVEKRLSAVANCPSEEALVHSRIYQTQLEFYRAKGLPRDFYHATLMFLTYTDLQDLTPIYRKELAETLAFASLTGDGIYNFGEILATPILSYLENQPKAWLGELVAAVHRGAVPQVRNLLATHANQLIAQDGHGKTVMKMDKDAVVKIIVEKASLLAIVQLAFHRPPADRLLSFQEVASVCDCPVDSVERLIMRAMSQQLLRGLVDEVSGQLQVTWVQPRVLDKIQLNEMGNQLTAWAERARTSLLSIEDQAVELYS